MCAVWFRLMSIGSPRLLTLRDGELAARRGAGDAAPWNLAQK